MINCIVKLIHLKSKKHYKMDCKNTLLIILVYEMVDNDLSN